MTRSYHRLVQIKLRRRRFRPMSIPWKYRSNCATYERSEVSILSVFQPAERTKKIQGPATSNGTTTVWIPTQAPSIPTELWLAFLLLVVLQILHNSTGYPGFHCQVSVVIFYNDSPFGTVMSLLYIVMPTSQMFRNLRTWNPSLKALVHVLLKSSLLLMQTTPAQQTYWNKDLVNRENYACRYASLVEIACTVE